MNRFAVVGLLILTGVLPAEAKKKATRKTNPPQKAEIETATRLQVFLDRANFSPGRIDGHYNDFTWKALALYRESQGEEQQAPPSQSGPGFPFCVDRWHHTPRLVSLSAPQERVWLCGAQATTSLRRPAGSSYLWESGVLARFPSSCGNRSVVSAGTAFP